MTSTRPRRKCASVNFIGDDDVVHHIVDAHENRAKGFGNKNSHRSKHKKRNVQDAEEDGSDEEVFFNQPKVLEESDGSVFGCDVFQFKTPKHSGQMALKASESKTPKSILKTTKSCEPQKTPTRVEIQTTCRTPKTKAKRQMDRPETTTPYRLRQRNVHDSDSDDSIASSEESSDEDKEEKKMKSITPSASVTREWYRHDAVEIPTMVEHYFDIHSSGINLTSDRTLSKLGKPKMDQESLNKVLESAPSNHTQKCGELYNCHREQFTEWMYHMCNGFNILLYGLGSKRSLIEDFRKTHLKEFAHLLVNGYFPSLTIKHILNSITEDILEQSAAHRNPIDHYEFIKKQFETGENRDFFLIIHNIDGSMLRNEKTQNILGLLSQVRGFHIIASVDHINSALIWDQRKCSQFNWLWFDVTSFLPYTVETSYENSLLVQQTGALALSSITHVMKSLTTNAKGIFLLLVKHQLENEDSSSFIGMSFQDLYQRCREAFLVNSDLTLNAQLTEFKDHKLIRCKQNFDGVEHLSIPVDSATLREFLEQQGDT